METGDIELHLLLLTCNSCFIFASYNYDFIIMRYLASVYTVFKMNILFVVKFLQKKNKDSSRFNMLRQIM